MKNTESAGANANILFYIQETIEMKLGNEKNFQWALGIDFF